MQRIGQQQSRKDFFETTRKPSSFSVYNLQSITNTGLFSERRATKDYIKYPPRKITAEVFLPEAAVHNFERDIEKQPDFESILKFGKLKFPVSAKDVFVRLVQLKGFVDEEIAEGEDVSLSLPSLRNLLVFLYAIETFNKPTITVGDDGLFQVNWRLDQNNVLTVRFDEEFHVTYVIFCPSRYESGRMIQNGSMHVLDFKDHLLKLKLKTHKTIG